MDRLRSAISASLSRLARLQVDSPRWLLSFAFVLTVISVVLALRLRVETGFEALLPESRPSARELHRVAEKTSGVSTIFIVLSAGDATRAPPTDALRRAADALVIELSKLGPPWVGSAEDGVHEAMKFLEPRAGLYVETQKLQSVRDRLQARFEYEVQRSAGTLLDETDEPPPIDVEALKLEFGLKPDDADRYPDGYYQSRDGRTVVIVARSKIDGGDFENGTEAIRRVHGVIDRVELRRFDASITYAIGGDLPAAISEYTAVNADLTHVGQIGVIAIATVVFLFYLRLRTLVIMVATVAVGVAWTFGVTELVIGNLNMATGFLFTIVAGNGINSGIIYMSRYIESRRSGSSVHAAILVSHRETWRPTLTAAAAAAAAYGSLMATEFRGFREFGIIGGVGMVSCWFGTYWVLPCLLALSERIAPIDWSGSGLLGRIQARTSGGIPFGKPFARLVDVAPRAMAAVGLLLAFAGFVAVVEYVGNDPMEYDLRNLRNDVSARSDEAHAEELADAITGQVGSDRMAILVDDPSQIAPLSKALYARRDAAAPNEKPFGELFTLQNFVPEDQANRIALLRAIKDKLVRAHKLGGLDDAAWKTISRYLPPDDLAPFGLADLPIGVARAFTESDGTRGRIVYISPVSNELVDDAHYLFRWADSFRETKLPDGRVVRGSGRAVIYADIWAAVVDDVPKAVLLSLMATALVVLVAFRFGRPALAVLGALVVGVAWMVGLLTLLHVRLNFLNFIALPLTFGIGVDYAVNIVERRKREGLGRTSLAVEKTGGAVVLCSLTTTLGYLALAGSTSYAVRSMGIAAVLGEVCCLAAAMLVLPACLVLIDRRNASRASLTKRSEPDSHPV